MTLIVCAKQAFTYPCLPPYQVRCSPMETHLSGLAETSPLPTTHAKTTEVTYGRMYALQFPSARAIFLFNTYGVEVLDNSSPVHRHDRCIDAWQVVFFFNEETLSILT